MKRKRLQSVRIIGAILFFVFTTAADVIALECWLVPNTSQCADNTTVNPCYTALSTAVASTSPVCDTIKVLPGTYPANNITLTRNITIYGAETARTFLTGNGGTAITVRGVNSAAMEIRNLTFTNASPSILIQNASSFNIKNNIFQVGNTTTTITAIKIEDTSSPVIMNNTFYQNGTAISSTPNTLTIINNIFSGNGLAISANVLIDEIRNNLFFQNTDNGPTGIIFNSADPNFKGNVNNINIDTLFVGITTPDFHLKSATPEGNTTPGANSINGVTPPDMGAYGGSGSDTIPFPVSGLTGTLSGSSIDLTWSPNPCYMIQGYRIFYSANKQLAPYDTTKDTGNVSSFSLGPLTTPTPPTMNAPVLTSRPTSGALVLTWTPSSGATGYKIYYKEHSDAVYYPITLEGTVTTFTLGGLTNPTLQGTVTEYDVYIEPFYQPIYYLAVKPFYNATDASKLALEYSNEEKVPFGTQTAGPVSNTITDFPEPITAYPNLPNKGCFIATAAYGHYSAPQVQALRKFRDEYLLTNGAGRAFVRWYYEQGPRAARFIDEHPSLKPVVRTALLPAVAGAMFLTGTSGAGKTVIATSLMIGIGCLLICRRKFGRAGGRQ